MKTTIAALVILLSSLASAQTIRNIAAGGNFTTPDSSLSGRIDVIRTQDSTTKVITTELSYSLCTIGAVVNCQEGNGRIPGSALIGDVRTQANLRDTLTLLVDTSSSAINGSSGCAQPGQTPCFTNFMCFGRDEFDDCTGGQGPATGGLFSVSWKKNGVFEVIIQSASKVFDHGKLTQSQSFLEYSFGADQTGTALGSSTGIAVNGFMLNSTDSQAIKKQFAARRLGN